MIGVFGQRGRTFKQKECVVLDALQECRSRSGEDRRAFLNLTAASIVGIFGLTSS